MQNRNEENRTTTFFKKSLLKIHGKIVFSYRAKSDINEKRISEQENLKKINTQNASQRRKL